MAYETPGLTVTFTSGADFSAGAQFRFVDFNSSGKVINPAASGDPVVGVRQNRPRLNEGATVVVDGISWVEAGAAVTLGANVMTDTTGRAIAWTTTKYCIGRALQVAAAAGVIIPVLILHNGIQA